MNPLQRKTNMEQASPNEEIFKCNLWCNQDNDKYKSKQQNYRSNKIILHPQ